MLAIIYPLLPVITTVITNWLKAIPVINQMSGGARLAVVRLIAAIVSFASVVLAHMLTDAPIEAASVQALIEAFLVFFGAIGVHEVTKQKVVQ